MLCYIKYYSGLGARRRKDTPRAPFGSKCRSRDSIEAKAAQVGAHFGFDAARKSFFMTLLEPQGLWRGAQGCHKHARARSTQDCPRGGGCDAPDAISTLAPAARARALLGLAAHPRMGESPLGAKPTPGLVGHGGSPGEG